MTKIKKGQERKAFLRTIFKNELTIAFIGQSGCGKETQLKRIFPLIQRNSPKSYQILHLESGGLFRKNTPSYSEFMSSRLTATNDEGSPQIAPFAITQWANEILYKWSGKGHILIDGTPRSESEARAMFDTYTKYLGREIIVFHLDIPDSIADARMIARNEKLLTEGKALRKDSDTVMARKKKLSFYHENVKDAISMLRDLGVSVHKIDGTKSINKIGEEILSFLSNQVST